MFEFDMQPAAASNGGEVIHLRSPMDVRRMLAAAGVDFPLSQIPVSDVSSYFVAPCINPYDVVVVRSGPNGYDIWPAQLNPFNRSVGSAVARHAGKARDSIVVAVRDWFGLEGVVVPAILRRQLRAA